MHFIITPEDQTIGPEKKSRVETAASIARNGPDQMMGLTSSNKIFRPANKRGLVRNPSGEGRFRPNHQFWFFRQSFYEAAVNFEDLMDIVRAPFLVLINIALKDRDRNSVFRLRLFKCNPGSPA